MLSISAVVLVLSAGLALVVFRTVRRYYALSDFDGPRSVGFSRLWLLWANGSGKMHLVFTEVNDKFGMQYSILLVHTRFRKTCVPMLVLRHLPVVLCTLLHMDSDATHSCPLCHLQYTISSHGHHEHYTVLC